eukprot:SAG11_NODE_607_length_8226_cov_11.234527_1_plen_259_part_00
MMFETFDVNGLYFSVPSIFSLYANGKTTGIVLDSGECITSCIPVIDGFVVQGAVQTLPFGGRDITTYLQRTLHDEDGAPLTMAEVEVIKTMKQEQCYCGLPKDDATAGKTYTLPDGKEVASVTEEFPHRIAEKFFFDPLKLDWDDTSMEESVQQKIMTAVMGCAIDSRKEIMANVLVTGGNTLFDGLPQLLFKNLKKIGKARAQSLKINASPERNISAWIGGSVLASLGTWENELITQEDYEEEGEQAIHKLNLLSLS